MRRAIALKAQEPGSKLAGFDLERWFGSDVETRRVYEIWESGLEDGETKAGAKEVLDAVGVEVFEELQWIAGRIADRGVSVLANCVLSTIIDMGVEAGSTPPVLFVEGSIALNPPMRRRVEATIHERAAKAELYERLGVIQPGVPVFDRDFVRPSGADGVSDEEAGKVELTLLGTASMAIAEDCMKQDGWA
ncbi:MAG: hypothetical protein ACOC2L_03120 [Candidatus Sumerlaeota bacterium]